jgi:hypothetical protein
VEGNQPRWTANTIIKMIPTQNVGIENPRIEPAIIVLLTFDFGFNPAYMPRGMPKNMAMNKENSASSRVAGIRWIISFKAGSPKINDRPKSP